MFSFRDDTFYKISRKWWDIILLPTLLESLVPYHEIWGGKFLYKTINDTLVTKKEKKRPCQALF